MLHIEGGTQSTCITNSAFLLATVATPINSTYSMHSAYRPCAFCSCAQLSGLLYTHVDCQHILSNARDIVIALYCLTASYPLTEMQTPIIMINLDPPIFCSPGTYTCISDPRPLYFRNNIIWTVHVVEIQRSQGLGSGYKGYIVSRVCMAELVCMGVQMPYRTESECKIATRSISYLPSLQRENGILADIIRTLTTKQHFHCFS